MSDTPSKPSWLTDLLIRLGLASRAGRWAAQFLVSRWLTRPPRQKIQRTPSQLGLDWEPLRLRTDDGHLLRGWLVTPSRPRATLLLFHGIEASREQMLSRLAFLIPAGYRCAVVDHRAHGESGGQISSFGLNERHDVTALLRLAQQQWPGEPIGLLGISMGAAAIAYSAQQVRSAARAVVLESLYHDILTTFHNRLNAGHYPAYFQRLTEGVVRFCEWRLGQPASRFTPANHIAELSPTPLLIVTGSEDRYATPQEAQRLDQRREGPGRLLLVPGAAHEDVCESGGLIYQRALLDFLDDSFFGEVSAAA